MSSPRNFLLMALAFTTFLLWQAWQQDYGTSAPAATTPSAADASRDTTPSASDVATRVDAGDVPKASSAASSAATTAVPDANSADAATSASVARAASPRIVVTTDVMRAEIDPVGGNLVRVDLLDYAYSHKERDRDVTLLDSEQGRYFVAQTGIVSDGPKVPDHNAVFAPAKSRYALANGARVIKVPLTWQQGGVTVRKTWTFARASYRIGLEQRVENAGPTPLALSAYGQLQREAPIGKTSFTDPNSYSFRGAGWWSPEERFEKVAFDDYSDEPLSRSITGGWAALLQHHFVAAIIPPAKDAFAYSTQALKGTGAGPRYLVRAHGPVFTVAPAASASLPFEFYVGPKLQDVIGTVAPGLNHTVDYGMVTVIAEPLYWLLSKIHSVVGNWGWAIVILTILIKLAFYKLSEAQYRSFARMRKFQPRMAALKERYGDDKEKLNRAMMELYQKEKINPMGGCLPMLVQIPVFIALYWVLIESVELRHAPWILWIQSLTDRDPYFVLPVLNGLAMYATQKLSPTSPGLDPMQAKMFQMMPVIMSVMFAFFPAGLVLYWTVNGVLGLIQQYVITKRIEASETTH